MEFSTTIAASSVINAFVNQETVLGLLENIKQLDSYPVTDAIATIALNRILNGDGNVDVLVKEGFKEERVLMDAVKDEFKVGFNDWEFQLRLHLGSLCIPRTTSLSRNSRPAILGTDGTTILHYKTRVVPLNKQLLSPGINPNTEGHEIIFSAQSMEELGLCITVYTEMSPQPEKTEIPENSGNSEKQKKRGKFTKFGRCIINPVDLQSRIGEIVRPLIDAKLRVVGELTCQYLIVSPFKHPKNILGKSELSYWSPHVDMIGHRGFGSNPVSFVVENTVLSFNTAHKCGIQYVEFDVHLTSDEVPVVYHDFFLQKDGVDVSIANMNLKQFKTLPTSLYNDKHTNKENLIAEGSPRLQRTRSATHVKDSPSKRWLITDQSFPTLEQLFKKVPTEVGFNVEIKYPHKPIEGQANYLERNRFTDRILEVIFNKAGNRPLYFSSFDPDICVLLAKKQSIYPVFFLTEGLMDEIERDYDYRCTTLEAACKFACSVGLKGIVTDAKALLKQLDMIQEIHNNKLLLFTYGRLNNDPKYVAIQKRFGVDAIISDKVTKVNKTTNVDEDLVRKISEEQFKNPAEQAALWNLI